MGGCVSGCLPVCGKARAQRDCGKSREQREEAHHFPRLLGNMEPFAAKLENRKLASNMERNDTFGAVAPQVLHCTTGHPITKHKMKVRWHQFGTLKTGCYCTVCGRTLQKKEPRWRCHNGCDHNVCDACYVRASVAFALVGAPPIANTAIVDTPLENIPTCGAVPDYSGKWVLDRVEGDWNAFTETMGYGVLKRKTLKALRWGIGSLTEEIRATPNSFWVKQATPISTTVVDLKIDGIEQDAIDPDHVPIRIKVWWVEGHLETDCYSKSSGKLFVHITRSLESDGNMKVVMRSPDGKEVIRYFVRQ